MIEVHVRKWVSVEVPNGKLRIKRSGDSYHLEYENPIYEGSPFKVPTSFSVEFSIPEIMESQEIKAFMSRFGGLS